MATKTERELIEAMRDDLRRAEALMERVVRNGKLVVAANASDAGKMNAASKAVGLLRGAHAGLECAHADATDLLLENWPDFAADVVTRGPGR
jgi:hypothetical protein